jgi:preprotein translocase subunit YajC
MITLFTAAANAQDPTAMTGYSIGSFVLMIVVVIAMYLIMFLPQRKKEKAQKQMRDNIQVGDEIVTIGGIIGFVLRKDDENECVVIETGGDRSKIRVKLWAVSDNLTQHDAEEELGKKK